MNILIIGTFHFPFGSANASRMRHYAKGLSEAGARVRVVSQIEIYDRSEDIGLDGQRRYFDVPYESILGFRYQYKEKKRIVIDRLLLARSYIEGAMKAAQRAKDIIESDKIDAIIQYNRSYISLKPFVRLCKRSGVLLVPDVTEWPALHFFTGGVLSPFHLDEKLAMYRAIAHADGVIGISRFLTDFYTRRGVPAIRIPAIIEIPEQMPEPFKVKPQNDEFNVTYLGGLHERDGPFEMIGAIRKLLARELPVRFTIVGSSGVAKMALKVRQMCENDMLLRKKVDFLGRVSDKEVSRRLRAADALLFVRPDDITAVAGFPTRLPEYLLSRRPVIVAGVGDIPEYLRDGIDAIIMKSCTADVIADSIENLMKMPDSGQSIGEAGFERARKLFNYKTRTKQILDFIQKLQKNKSGTLHLGTDL